MTNYPNSIDDDSVVPFINSNFSEVGPDVINSLRDIAFVLEQTLGINPQGTAPSLSDRLGVSLNLDGTIKSSSLTSLGLVTLPITDAQVSVTAGIVESKLSLDYSTSLLNSNIINTNNRALNALGWINATGSKLQPHLDATAFRHQLQDIDLSANASLYLQNKFTTLLSPSYRNNSNSFNALNDLNNELLYHEQADGYGTVLSNVTTHNASTYPSTYAHVSSGIYLNSLAFSTIPKTITDLQLFAQFVNDSSLLLLGTRIQNFYANGISRSSRASAINLDGYGLSVIPVTPVIAYLLNTGVNSTPFDNINNGDDMVEFKPSSASTLNNSFDAQFALVKIGDILRINYGTVQVSFIIKEKKYVSTGGKKYYVRIAGKNLFYSATATARIDKPTFNINKNGNLAIAAVNNTFGVTPSLLVGSPRGAEVIGVGFNINQFDSTHYNLYLGLYTTGNPSDGYIKLPAIDVTGNLGTTPGQYTISSIVRATNSGFRALGYNYRFMAFSKDGEFGVKLADSVNNVGFSIFSSVIKADGNLDHLGTTTAFPNNVIDLFPASPAIVRPDGLGFDGNGSNVASPPYMVSYGSTSASQLPTKIFLPLDKETYYVNGVERDRVSTDIGQFIDGYGSSYWNATVKTIQSYGNRLEVTYNIPVDLSSSQLKPGKSILVQSFDGYQAADGYDIFDFGRFTISSMVVGCGVGGFCNITVYDATHALGLSPPASTLITVGTAVRIYAGYESITFNNESSTDTSSVSVFKRHFEVYIDQLGKTFTHERGRMNITGGNVVVNGITLYVGINIRDINIIRISPNFRGYQFSSVNKIALNITSYDLLSGNFSGFLASYDGTTFTKKGPTIVGKKGQVIRFYDNSNIDFIDFLFEFNVLTPSFTNQVIDIQLFPSLANDGEIMGIGTCQLNDSTNFVDYIIDIRQFGNVSEKELNTSALNFINTGNRLTRSNGIISGFDLVEEGYLASSNVSLLGNQTYIKGGKALVNGKIVELNDQIVTIPLLKELYNSIYYNIVWVICANEFGKYQIIPLLDNIQSISSPTVTTRLFNVYNPINTLQYNIDATTFSNLINNRKDLTPIYYVLNSLPMPYTSASLYITDMRRYINDVDSNLEIVLTSDNASGNFKSIEATIAWINTNSSFNNHVKMRGTFNIASIQVFNFQYLLKPVIFEGDGCTINVQVDNGIILGSNITFKNINFVYNFNTTTTTSDFVNNGHGLMQGQFNSNVLTNVRIEDCTFSLVRPDAAVNNQRYSYININITNAISTLSNIYFINNSFTSGTTSLSDFNAAISIINSSAVSGLNKPTLTNCYIEKNLCDSEQVIVLTNVSNGASVANPGLRFFNTIIEKNTCGAIGFISAALGLVNVNDFNNKISISNNNVKYITNLDHKGKYIAPTGLGYISGNIVIDKNSCSFIHLGINSVPNTNFNFTSSQTSLKILNNNLANNSKNISDPHVTDYISNFGYPLGSPIGQTGTRYAIYVGNFDADSKSCITLIDGNVTQFGAFNGYESCLRTDVSAIITNNRFGGMNNAFPISQQEFSTIIYNGAPSNYHYFYEFTSYSGIISNNFISRQDGSAVYAFITTYGTASESTCHAKVTNNIFSHSYTASGGTLNAPVYLTSLCLDGGGIPLENFWVIEQNKNQIKTAIIPQNNDQSLYNLYATQGFGPTGIVTSGYAIARSEDNDGNLLGLQDNSLIDGVLTRRYAKGFNLKSYVPSGARVLTAQMNAYLSSGSGSIDTSGGNQATFTISITKSQPVATMLDTKNIMNYTPNPVVTATYTVTPTNAIALAAGNITILLDSSGTIAPVNTSTNVTVSTSGSIHLGSNYDCNIFVKIIFLRAVAGGIPQPFDLWFSPIVVQYTW